MTPHFTPIESCILEYLSDGRPHQPRELLACIGDSEASVINVRWHLKNIRAKIRPGGDDILCEIFNRSVHYRRVHLLASANGKG